LFRPQGFRARLLVAMMLVVSVITALVLYFAERNLARDVEQDLQRAFRGELATLHHVQGIRQAALVERCRALVRRSRIHAAIEDGALDLLYPSARDELRDIMGSEGARPDAEPGAYTLHAEFYRFLDRQGGLIAPMLAPEAGPLRPEEESRLTLPGVPGQQQTGYLARADGAGLVSEIIAMPILSSETGEVIAALVLGFKPVALGPADTGIKRGLWFGGRLHLPGLAADELAALDREVAGAIATRAESSFACSVGGVAHQLYYVRLNPGALYPPAYEVCVYPLTDLLARQRQLRWRVLAAGGLLLLGAFGASHFLAGRLSRPVEKLAVTSAENLASRERAEAALESTSEELQRAARFSADASHQLKTPVAVLRAGLEELQAQEDLAPDVDHEVAALIHQTYRLSSVIEDLLLLSRLDAGQLKLKFGPVNLSQLIEGSLDDLRALPDASALEIETDFPPALHIAGDKQYASLILQNLLENARKYNQPGGRIRLTARPAGDQVFLTIGNTGRAIPPEAQARIFERFHRGAIGENVPGHGLGLNLARELARLHQGDLRLLRSADGWTEFEVRFGASPPAPVAPPGAA
jgi:signal transduction histidine kinase